VGSQEFTFTPQTRIKGGAFTWDIGTAGSTTMLMLSILPLACLAETPVVAQVTGGVFQDFAPSPHHMQHVLAPLLQRMGAAMTLRVLRAGYVPAGAGLLELCVTPGKGPLSALTLREQGEIRHVSGLALASHLEERRVSERMAQTCEQRLVAAGFSTDIERIGDMTARHAGASLAVWAESSTGCLFGADRIGAVRRSAEAIGRFVVDTFLADLRTGATVDRHLSDQLVMFAALAQGNSHYRIPYVTDHVESNLWLLEQFGVQTECRSQEVSIRGLGVRQDQP
jgi:RNA 3'-terminal phosphate cyclase (ATP)